MRTLVAGKIDALSPSFYQKLKKRSKLTVIHEPSDDIPLDERMKAIHPSHMKQQLHTLFSAHTFQNVIYFLSTAEDEVETQEVEKLVHLLDACTAYPPQRILIITATNSAQDSTNHSQTYLQKHHVLTICDDLCRLYREHYELPISILKIPYLFGTIKGNGYLAKKMHELVVDKKVTLDGQLNQEMDFLAQTDFAVLLNRILLEPEKSFAHLEVPGKARLTVQEFAEVLRSKVPDAAIKYSDKELFTFSPINTQDAYQLFRWQPEIDVRDELDEAIATMEKTHNRRRLPLRVAWQKLHEKYASILISLELFLGYFLMQFINEWTLGLVPFRSLDFRLLFVVIFAAVHGHKAGILAATLAQMALIIDFLNVQVDWRIIFYNINNWIPFAAYLVVGTVLGFIRDHHKKQKNQMDEETTLLVNQYVFLNDMYNDLLNSKVHMERNVISSTENYGRLFHTLARLEEAAPATFHIEAIHAIEDLLENYTISFYQVGENMESAFRVMGFVMGFL